MGVDFGTSGVRALVLDTHTGAEPASCEAGFPHWEALRYCDPPTARYRQHPQELVDSFVGATRDTLANLPADDRARVSAVTVVTTGSSPVPVDRRCRPLACSSEFADDPDAMVVLWKDRSAVEEAEMIAEKTRAVGEPDFLAYSGGTYSPEWYWAKVLRIIRCNERVARAAATWLEHCDWFAALLCGVDTVERVIRSRCGAAHKALWHSTWSGFPPAEFFRMIDPGLESVRRSMPSTTFTSDAVAGRLSPEWARRLGLPSGIPVGVGLFDAHAAALGAGVRPGVVVKVIGTSSAEMVVASPESIGGRALPGIESQAEGSIIPEAIGIEAGQPAYGDLLAWLSDIVVKEANRLLQRQALTTADVLASLSTRAEQRPPCDDDVIALDWFNGRRAPFANARARAGIEGLTLGTDAPALFSALVRAGAFGTRAIHEHLAAQNVDIAEIRVVGGIPKRAPYVIQCLSDVLNSKVGVVATEHASARGAAIMAAVAAGLYADAVSAVKVLASPIERTYTADPERARAYEQQYLRYRALGACVDPSLPSAPSPHPGTEVT